METLSTNRRIRSKPQPLARCQRNHLSASPLRTSRSVTHAFLKQRFLPLYQPSFFMPDNPQVENDFYRSLANLSHWYGFEPLCVTDKAFPYNVLLSHWDASRKINKMDRGVELMIVRQEDDSVQLATRNIYEMGTVLYYIPVLPLYRLLQHKRQRRVSQLLLSVFAYLFHTLRIPYYREPSTALHYYYEMITEWFCEDIESYDAKDAIENLSELEAAKYYGDRVLRQLYHPFHISEFQERIARFHPANTFEQDCLNIANEAFALLNAYPGRTVMDNILPSDNEGVEVVRMEQYVSFVAATEGWLANNLIDMINNELNECSEIEQPCVIRYFGQPQEGLKDSLHFEQRLFSLLNNLCVILNDIP